MDRTLNVVANIALDNPVLGEQVFTGTVTDGTNDVDAIVTITVTNLTPPIRRVQSKVELDFNVNSILQGQFTGNLTKTTDSTQLPVVIDITALDVVPVAPIISAGNDLIIQEPEDTVTLTGTVEDGPEVTNILWTKLSGTGNIQTPKALSTIVTGIENGTSAFQLYVKNADALSTTDIVEITRTPLAAIVTKWGAKINDVSLDKEILLAKEMNLECIRTSAYQMSTYSPSARTVNLDTWYNNGFKCVTVVTWNSANPSRFPTGADLETFKTKLRSFLEDHGDKIYILVIENEPTNETFYDYANGVKIEDYIAQLRAAALIAQEFGIMCADGCTHIPYVEALRVGTSLNTNKNLPKVKAILDACANMPGLTHSNFHMDVVGHQSVASIPTAIEYALSITKKRPMSNEYHHENSKNGVEIVNATDITNAVNAWKDKVEVCLIWDQSEAQNKGGALTINSALTSLGVAYKNAIQ